MKNKTCIPLLALGLFVVPFASAAVITDPTRVTGSNAIDPLGKVSAGLTPGNVTAQATLEATVGFGAVQTFTGFTAGSNILSFTDVSLPDVQFSFTGSSLTATTGAEIANSNFVTSNPSAVRFESTANSPATTVRTMTATMTFGNYDTGTQIFTSATTGSLVAPRTVGFTFAGANNRMFMFDSVVATFRDLTGGVVVTQSLTGLNIPNDATSQGGYFGYQSDTRIGSVDLTITTQAIAFTTTPIVGIDDFGFAVIPEPSTYGLLMVAGIAGVALMRRRRMA